MAEDAHLRMYAISSILVCGFVACAAIFSSGLRETLEENNSKGNIPNPMGFDDSNLTDYRVRDVDGGSGSEKIIISMDVSIVKTRPTCLCIGAGEIVQYVLTVTEIDGVERIPLKSVYLSVPGGNGTKGFHNLSLESLLTHYNTDLKIGFGDWDSDDFLSVGDEVSVDAEMYNGLTFILHNEDSHPIWKNNYCMYYLYDWES